LSFCEFAIYKQEQAQEDSIHSKSLWMILSLLKLIEEMFFFKEFLEAESMRNEGKRCEFIAS
jgi:hypothetical protein